MLEREFLIKMARDRELSPNQEQIFIMRFAEEKDYEEIAIKLRTSAGACLKQMGQVYKKFAVSGNHRGKENRLRISLLNQFLELAQAKDGQKLSEEKFGNADISGILDEYMEEMAFIESYKIPVLISNQKAPQTSALKLQDFTAITPPLLAIATPYHNLPTPHYTNFINGETEMAKLLEMLSCDRAPQIVNVNGVTGFGKTTLVLEAAYRCLQASRIPQAYPSATAFDAIIFTSAKEIYLTGDICRAIAHTLNRPDLASVEQLESIKECLSKIRTLLIVDNLESVENPQEIISFLSELPPTVKVVITTRSTSPITVVGQASCLPLTALFGEVYSKPPISGDGWINSAD